MQHFETIALQQVENHPEVYIITLNRPERLNALNTKMAVELIEVFTNLKQNDSIRALIFTGAGERSFCSGADLKERKGMSNKEWKEQHDLFEEAASLIRKFPFPTIAAINGYALAGGLELALRCDIRIAANHAIVGLTEATIGIIPGLGGTQLLPRMLPVGIAKELLFSGRKVPVTELAPYGLFNKIVPIDQLLEESIELAKTITANAPLSLQSLKRAVDQGIHLDVESALRVEMEQYYVCANSEDRLEGINSFNEKRKPVWKNR